MLETRVTEFAELSVDLRVEISRSASGVSDWLFFLPIIDKICFHNNISIIFFNFLQLTLYDGRLRSHLGLL